MGEQEEGEQRKNDAVIAFAGGWLVGSGSGIILGDVKLGLILGAGLGVILGLLRMKYGSKTEKF
ncbi:hypothetical protein ACSAZK_13200 [Methanosarcina sp. Mfa9]|uniref:hypothetical protein n=1 Tax=Methanosarcina sp. Mfa9 TaxID=3439063 RepID=UPI003F879A05